MRAHPVCAVVLVCMTVVLSGCGNRYRDAYKDATNGAWQPEGHPAIALRRIESQGRLAEDEKEVLRDQYQKIGHASFAGTGVDESEALALGRELRAEVVLTAVKFTGTRSDVRPVVTTTPGQTITTVSKGNAHDGAGSTSYKESTTTYVPEQRTVNYVPYTSDWYDYDALYFVRLPSRPIFGAVVAPLPEEVAKMLSSRSGVVVRLVYRGCPAARANVFEGDILVKLNGAEIHDDQDFSGKLDAAAGQTVTLELLRDGNPARRETLTVQLAER